MNLPKSPNLPVEYLAAGFSDVTNSYKFFWFLSILEHVRENQSTFIPINDLLAMMIASVWYPTNYFLLSFGKQDRLGQITLQVGKLAGLSSDSTRQEVIRTVQSIIATSSPMSREILSLGNYVPYRFLRPFFATQLRGLEDWKVNDIVVNISQQSFTDAIQPCLYRIILHPRPAIEIQSSWFMYLKRHLPILTGFTFWHLVNYLEKHNPNVPNISAKLFEPARRDLNQAREFWRTVFDKAGQLTCIYSGQKIQKKDFSLDHFLPWRFVAHDLLWNIIPVPKSVNSSKGDTLPDFNRYFTPFVNIQYRAIQAIVDSKKNHLLEDYVLLFSVDSIEKLQELPFRVFRDKYRTAIAPQFQIAANMGFSTGWIYV